ncbi:MarP family serine protease [Agromyces sp. SYSU T00194]|uniref:MarP family serine protease n=1 Tax=Agromyces chitinivorans TaxID=3158560 RepID=UPI003398E621
MNWTLVLDLLLIAALAGAFVRGWRSGLLHTAGGLAGIVAGGVAAYFLLPVLMTWIPWPGWRIAGAFAAALLLLVAGASIGGAIGRMLRSGAETVKLAPVDRLLGGAATTVVAALVIAMLGGGIAAMGVPWLSPVVAGSAIVRGIDRLTPEPARAVIAQVRQAAFDDAIPWLFDALGQPTEAPEIPEVDTAGPELQQAAQSVVRISGAAFQCGISVTGSGFVVASDRVVTNAHVVAGIDEPVVEAPGRTPVPGRVVYYDEEADLAVIATSGLDAAPLELGDTLASGAEAVVAGYPYGGPLEVTPAQVLSAGPLVFNGTLADRPRDAYTLAAAVYQGDSGGPVLTTDGVVAGVVFGKAQSVDDVGYAVTMVELDPVADAASGLTQPVATGSCHAG